MGDREWNLHKVMHLRKIQLIQSNLIILMLIVLFSYIMKNGVTLSVLVGFCCISLWSLAAILLYTLKTGKTIGTKTMRRVYEFEKDQWGEKSWKRRTMIGAVLFIILGIVCTTLFFVIDFNSERLDSIGLSPFVGSWLAINTVEISRIIKLRKKVSVS